MFRSFIRINRLRPMVYSSTNWIRNLSNENDITNNFINEDALKRKRNYDGQRKHTTFSNNIDNLNIQSTATDTSFTASNKTTIKTDSINAIDNENSEWNDDLPSNNQSSINQSSINNQLINDIKSCDDISSLLDRIQPYLTELTSNDLKLIFTKINLIYLDSIRNRSDQEFKDIINTSFVFNSLINGIVGSKNSDIKCLLTIYTTFSILGLDNGLRPIRYIFNSLKYRLEEFDFSDIKSFYNSLTRYNNDAISRNEMTIELTISLRKLAANKLSEYQFNAENMNDLINSLNLFYDDQDSVPILVENLLNNFDLLNFKQLVYLNNHLKKIKRPKSFGQFDELINKCNSRLYELFVEDSSKKNVEFYLRKVHDRRDIFWYNDVHDSKLLDLLTPIILNNSKNLIHEQIFNLIYNFGKSKIFNEQLLQSVYEWICTNDQFAIKSVTYKFLFFTKYRFAFLNSDLLANRLLLNSSTVSRFQKLFSKNQKHFFALLNYLILSDVMDPKVYENFSDQLMSSLKKDVDKSTIRDYKLNSLAKVYLEHSQMNKQIKNQLARKLKNNIDDMTKMGKRPVIHTESLKLNDKLQFNGYLTNGILLDRIGIFDKTINGLISLNEFKNHFHKIDHIEINSDQCLFTFAFKYRLKGANDQYETLYHYKLKKFLDNYNIKSIDIFKDEFNKIATNEDKTNFLIQKAIDHFQSKSIDQ